MTLLDLEPLKVTLPDYPFVGALVLTLRDEQDQRFAANYVNLVVKPDRSMPRIERRGPNDVAVRFEPGAFATPALVRAGEGAGRQGLRSWQGLLRVPDRTPCSGGQRSSRVDLLPVPGRLEGERENVLTGRSGSTARTIPRPTWPATGASTLAVVVSTVDWSSGSSCPTMPPTLAAFSPTWPGSSTAATASWSTARSTSPIWTAPVWRPANRWSFASAFPTMRLMPAACASSAPPPESYRWIPTLQIHTREPLPADLGVDPHAPGGLPHSPLKFDDSGSREPRDVFHAPPCGSHGPEGAPRQPERDRDSG